MQRILGIDDNQVETRIAAVLQAQRQKWGAPLLNHLVYARCPAIFRAVRGMWSGLGQSGLLTSQLVALINRRVAFLNQCAF